ncbi:hypothetical protein F4821DRAFT_81581 [Hypoxylon rubiginosum]|uniref:Uncharacterized protein n=1 Tax=Hypoxylon rubiginosum TaxID=110542 RepID=A0ACC0D7N2_9PEZI|nr:hypothetical protein F4821DRAFT_81581 [Hypoxylon rubiginosum]
MNLGPKSNNAFKQQQPTYHLAPNFTTRPFPDGPLELGTLVEDIRQYYPLNQGASRIPIPLGQRYSDIKEDINVSLKNSRDGEASLIAKALSHSVSGEASLKGEKKDEDIYKIQKLETSYFYPQPSYIKKCLQLSDVEDYLDMGEHKEPVYLITGLKIAWGATISTERSRRYNGEAEVGLTVPGGLIDVNVEAKAAAGGHSTMSSSFGKPTDFVLGIQVQKIYHKKKIFSAERVLTTTRVVKGAVLVDDDEAEAEVEDDDTEDNFIIAALDDAEMWGLVPWCEKDSQGQDEKWIVPIDIL